MISGTSKKKVSIHITTYKPELDGDSEMEDRNHKKSNKSRNRFVCALCLNSKVEEKTTECCQTVPTPCLKCVKNCDDRTITGKKEKERIVGERKRIVSPRSPAKIVQTSETEVAQGLSLLNEVLTVFQNKKVDINKEKVKSGLLKDVAVSTDDQNNQPKDPSRLTISTFQYSIDETKKPENGKFTVVNCCQPDYVRKQHSLDLIKHKSSSIPQMKLEELKYSLKEKTRSKDAIEEVNRMFATVRRSGKYMENSNRPMVRSGPRVLPLVKNNDFYQEHRNELGISSCNKHSRKCCQTRMSSGDSLTECCHDTDKERCDKCVYMLCCHYENKRKRQTGLLICEHCRSLNEENCVDDGC